MNRSIHIVQIIRFNRRIPRFARNPNRRFDSRQAQFYPGKPLLTVRAVTLEDRKRYGDVQSRWTWMSLQRRVGVQRRMSGGKTGSKLIRGWMSGRQAWLDAMPRRRGRRLGTSGIRRHYPPPVRTAFQFVNHLHHGVRVAARNDRYLCHRSVATVPNAVRPDLHPIESQVRSPRQMGLDRGLDLGSGIHVAGLARERENRRREGSGQPPHRQLHGTFASVSGRLPKPDEPVRARLASPKPDGLRPANLESKSRPCLDRRRP